MPTAKGVGASRISGPVRPWNPHALLAFGFKPKEYETVRFIDADADLVAALRNAFPALEAAARRSLAYEDFLRGHGRLTQRALRRFVNEATDAHDCVLGDHALTPLTALLERLPK